MKNVILLTACVLGCAHAGTLGWSGPGAVAVAARDLRTPGGGGFFYSTYNLQPFAYYNTVPLRYNYALRPQFTFHAPPPSAFTSFTSHPTTYFTLSSAPAAAPGYFPAAPALSAPSLPVPGFPDASLPVPSLPFPTPIAPAIPGQSYEKPAPTETASFAQNPSEDIPSEQPQSPPTDSPPQSPGSSPIFPGNIPSFPGFPIQSGNLPSIPGLPSFPGGLPTFPGGSAPTFPGEAPSSPAEAPASNSPASFPSAEGGDKGINDEDTISVEAA